MTNRNFTIVALMSAFLVLSACSSMEKEAPLDEFRWMLGDWRAEQGSNLIIESWREASGKTFEGMGSTLDKDQKKVTSKESLRLVSMSGETFYFAKVGDNSMPTPFKLVSYEDDTATFENLKHDFPQRLIYQRVDENHLRVDVQSAEGQGFTLKFARNAFSPSSAF
ncbi:MAG: hypothetical protein ACI97A_003903 [Planctomycetota bacterium]|jgi:hypothetical protein